jgi:hypothetical protein
MIWWTKDEGDGSKLETQRTDVASVVSVLVNDDFLRENLRRFVAERVFPKFKFIFKETTLGQVVEMANQWFHNKT